MRARDDPAGSSLLVTPVLGYAKQRLGPGATAGEGIQIYMCAAPADAVVASLAVTAARPAWWRIDPVVGLGITGLALREGVRSRQGGERC